jgi:hypothetical protein
MEDIEVKRSKVEHFKIKQRSPRFSAFLLDSNLSNAERTVMKSIKIKQERNTLDHLKTFWSSWKTQRSKGQKMTISKIVQNQQWPSGSLQAQKLYVYAKPGQFHSVGIRSITTSRIPTKHLPTRNI